MSKQTLLEADLENELFRSASGIVEYVVIEEELNMLFSFCLSFQESTNERLKGLLNQKAEYEKEPTKDVEFDGFQIQNSDLIQGLDDVEIPSWTSILGFTVPVNQIVLLYSFVEKSLKSLCSEYHPSNNSAVYGGFSVNLKQKPGKSKIETYLIFLKENCGFQIEIPSQLSALNREIRSIRNLYVHGDWENVQGMIAHININAVFILVSNLFYSIEVEFLRKSTSKD